MTVALTRPIPLLGRAARAGVTTVPVPAPRVEASSRALTAPAHEEYAGRDIVEEWGMDSFPASDPPANW